MFIDTGAYSENSDFSVFQNSILRNKIPENEFNIPEHHSHNWWVTPSFHISVHDEAFGLSTQNHNLSMIKKKE
jgi:hypothetical protein